MGVYSSYPDYLKKRYGHPIYRVGVDGGFNCPNRENTRHGGCAFCDGTGSVAVYQRNTESGFFRNSGYDDDVASRILDRFASIEAQIEKGKAFLRRRYKAEEFALYFQSWTNTYDSVDNLRRIYDKALSYGPFREFIISTRPDCLSEDILDLIESYKTDLMDVWVELGLQSANDATLMRINRGHDVRCYLDAVKSLKQRGIKVSTHVILGLPGETQKDYINTMRCVSSSGSDAIKIHNLHVSGGTLLSEGYLDGNFTVASVERHLEDTELSLRHLKSDIIVQRLICETPMHRLLSPRHFIDKSLFLSRLQKRMEENGTRQGDLYEA